MFRPLLAVLGLLFASGPVWPQVPPAPSSSPSPEPVRVEVPVEAVRLSDGTWRYGVRVSVGGKVVLAGIDTGASGLRLLPDAAEGANVEPTATAEVFSFGSGARPAGVIGRTRVAIGALSGEGAIHLVTKVDCVPGRPQCPGRLGLGYGFLGNGLPGEGFRALLGGSMGPTTVDTPLKLVGARRWIIELPRPGETGPGRLVLNPSAAEVAQFRMVRLVGGFAERDGGGLHDAVLGCLGPQKSEQRLCGLTTLDTGAFFIRLLNAPTSAPALKPGETLSVEFMDPDRRPVASAQMVAGGTAQQIAYGAAPVRQSVLQLGVWPYYAFSVLYDPAQRRIGLKPRPPVEGLPFAD